MSVADAMAVSGGPTTYQPGTCNIGPAEIARRRRLGHVGLVVTLLLAGGLIAVDAPPLVRLLFVGLAAAGTAIDYLQVLLRFCVAFGSRGVFNFGPLGALSAVRDPAARSRDRRRAAQVVLAGLLIGLAAGSIAAILSA
jgi:hypothetical protein